MPQSPQHNRRSFPGQGLITALAVIFCAFPALAGPPQDYDFDFVTIGAVGNAPYPGGMYGGNAGRGQVNYEYRMARMEVSTAQWMEFVNTFSTQGIDMAALGQIFSWGAVVDNSYVGEGRRYKLNPNFTNAEMLPVTGISWRTCAKFVNWLHNDKSSSPDALTHGAYDTSTFTQNPDNTFNDQVTRSPGAKYWIPSLDEWLKAAHYDPNKYGPDQEGWWEYSTTSDTAPMPGPPGEGQTSAGVLHLPGTPDPLSFPLGSYPDVQSPWGLLDTSGGAAEWNEEWYFASSPRLRGLDGSAAGMSIQEAVLLDSAENLDAIFPLSGAGTAGLRIASRVPAPSTLLIVAGVFALRKNRTR